MNALEFRENLESGDLARCTAAAAAALQVGDGAIDAAAVLVTDHGRSRNTRFWSLEALGQFSERRPSRIAAAVVPALADQDAGVRAVALQILARMRPREAVEAITQLLGDTTRDPTDWSDSPRSIGDAAQEALSAIEQSKADA
jgi:HEAT repeat protein